MTPAQTRLLADLSLAALSASAGVAADAVRTARDDISAPSEDIELASLRRVWLWALGNLAPNRSAAALAAGVSRPTIRRAIEAVDAWSERDADNADCLSAAAELMEGLARSITEGPAVLRCAAACAQTDRRDLVERRARAKARPGYRPIKRTRDLHRVRPVSLGL